MQRDCNFYSSTALDGLDAAYGSALDGSEDADEFGRARGSYCTSLHVVISPIHGTSWTH